MHRGLSLLLILSAALGPGAVPAQTKTPILITIGSDRTCLAAGLHVPCREVGPKLREASSVGAAVCPEDEHRQQDDLAHEYSLTRTE